MAAAEQKKVTEHLYMLIFANGAYHDPESRYEFTHDRADELCAMFTEFQGHVIESPYPDDLT